VADKKLHRWGGGLTKQGAVHRTDDDDYMPGFHALQIWRASKELELERQRLMLLERRTRLIMWVLATLFAMAFLTAALFVAPIILPLPLAGAAITLAHRWR
jgi:hypothetical protein